MAVGSWTKLPGWCLVGFVALCVWLGESSGALTSEKPGRGEFRRFRSGSEPTAPPPGVRLHTGVVASVVIIAVGAVVAAVFIIRKYCFPQSNATYRYSVLRQMEERREEESDEELLE